MNKTQLVQNARTMEVMKLSKNDHITDARNKLHWLPIEARIEIRIIVLHGKALNNMAPSYIKDMFKIKERRSGLGSNNSIVLCTENKREGLW